MMEQYLSRLMHFQYNIPYRLRNEKPLFLLGGFPSWRLSYPMYCRYSTSTVDSMSSDVDFARDDDLQSGIEDGSIDLASYSFEDGTS